MYFSPNRLMTFGDTGVPVFNDVAFGAPRLLDDEVPVAVLTAAPLAVMTFMAVMVFIAFMAFETGATRVQLGTEAPMEALVAALAARFGGVTIETTGGR